MSDQPVEPMDITSDDKLWAMLAYIFSPIIPIILLVWNEKKDRPFIKAHNIQALIMGVVIWIVASVVATFTCGLGYFLWFVMFYWAFKAYQGNLVNIPVITDFCKKQGWA
jgi:uncharacterized membrane protein